MPRRGGISLFRDGCEHEHGYEEDRVFCFSGPTSTGLKVDINTAEPGELATLPMIDMALANGIIKYGEENGSFLKPEDVINVPGFSPQQYRIFKSVVVVE